MNYSNPQRPMMPQSQQSPAFWNGTPMGSAFNMQGRPPGDVTNGLPQMPQPGMQQPITHALQPGGQLPGYGSGPSDPYMRPPGEVTNGLPGVLTNGPPTTQPPLPPYQNPGVIGNTPGGMGQGPGVSGYHPGNGMAKQWQPPSGGFNRPNPPGQGNGFGRPNYGRPDFHSNQPPVSFSGNRFGGR
jgi:hypothetical protein